jgi:hypothetical protein
MKIVKLNGYKVPDDISIAGFTSGMIFVLLTGLQGFEKIINFSIIANRDFYYKF